MSRLLVPRLLLSCVVLGPSLSAHGGSPAAPRKDRHGDPLPEGAIARLGTVRFRSGSQVVNVAYSPDGRFLATSGYDGIVYGWNTASGMEVFRIPPKRSGGHWVPDMEFSPDGKMLAIVRTGDQGIRLWDVGHGEERPGLKLAGDENAIAITISPDGTTLAAICSVPLRGGGVHRRIRLWHLKTGAEVAGFQSPENQTRSIAFAPDSKSLAVGLDGEICVCDAATGRKLRTLQRYKGKFAVVAFSAGGTIASATQDEKFVRLWDAATGQPKHVLRGHTSHIVSLAFSPDGKRLISTGAADRFLRVWDVARGELLHTHQGGAEMSGRCLALSPDGRTVVVGGGRMVLARLDVTTGEELAGPAGHQFGVGFVAFLLDGRIATSGANASFDTILRVWSADGRPLVRIQDEREWIARVAISPDHRSAALGGMDGTVRLWDLATGKEKRTLGKEVSPVSGLSFAPDGKTLAIGQWTQTQRGHFCRIRLCDVASGKEIQRFQSVGPRFDSLAFSADGKKLASLTGDVHVLEIPSGAEEGAFPPVSAATHGRICFSPDGSLLAAPSRGFEVWSVATRALLFREEGPMCRCVAFSPDGRLFACGRDDGSVEVWEVLTWTRAGKRRGPDGCVYAVSFSSDGRSLVSGHQDTTALIWDVASWWTPAEKPAPMTKERFDVLWEQLGEAQADRAYPALAALCQAPAETLPFLRRHLLLARAELPVSRLIADLDSDVFAVRERASQRLREAGPIVVPELRKALAAKPSLEVRRRLEDLMQTLESKKKPHELTTAAQRQGLRAVAILEQIGTPEARRLLADLAHGDAAAPLTRAARAAQARMTLPTESPKTTPGGVRIVNARLVLAAIVQAAEDNQRLPKPGALAGPFRRSGDELTVYYVRAAAAAARRLPAEQQGSAFLLALGIALDDADLLRDNLLTRSLWRRIEPEAARRRRLRVLGVPTLHGRRDLAQHFAVSAALTAAAGPEAAEGAGVLKELLDTRGGGSGFSFADLAADLAGVAFARRLLDQPGRLAGIEKGFALADYTLSPKDLPEGMTSAEFVKKYGSTKDERFRRMQTDIRKRIAALPGYRKD